MAVRFLIVAARPGREMPRIFTNLDTPAGLACAVREPDLIVFCSSTDHINVLSEQTGVVLGHVFERTGTFSQVKPANRSHRLQLQSHHGLISDYWGGYVAVQKSKDEPKTTIMRDPSGSLPCFWADVDGCTVLASDLDLLVDLKVIVPSIHWPNVQRHLLAGGLATASTCLSGIMELLPGNKMTLKPSARDIEVVWTPWVLNITEN